MEIDRIERTFRALAARGEELSERFYGELFRREPTLRPLFSTDLTEQRRKLVASLALIVGTLRQPQKLAAYLHQLGAGHLAYGARPEHYPVVGETLLLCLRELSGNDWDASLDRAWREAYAEVERAMLAGAATRPPGN